VSMPSKSAGRAPVARIWGCTERGCCTTEKVRDGVKGGGRWGAEKWGVCVRATTCVLKVSIQLLHSRYLGFLADAYSERSRKSEVGHKFVGRIVIVIVVYACLP
jgi:hypothetical protein